MLTNIIIGLNILLVIASFVSILKYRVWFIYGLRAQRFQLALLLFILLLFYSNFQHSNLIINLIVYSSGLLAIVFNIWSVLPFTFLKSVELPNTRKVTNEISLLTANVRMSNEDYSLLLKQIQIYRPDIILLTEVNEKWISWISDLEKTYNYTCIQAQENTYGMALYSKYPLTDTKVEFLVDEEIPSIHCKIKFKKGKIIQFLGLHPKPPAPWTKEEDKDTELLIAANRTNKNKLPTIITGDLNDVAWSPATKHFKLISGLIDPRIGRGFFNTYNAFVPFFRMPIDHFFVSDHFTLIKIKRLEKFGSDHFPVYIQLNLESDKS